LDGAVFTESASVLSNHAHFLATETSVFDGHAEERVFVLLVIGSKGVLVEQHQFRVIGARFREVGSCLLMVAIRLDSRCIRSSLVIVL
jgi:hypothetical protein